MRLLVFLILLIPVLSSSQQKSNSNGSALGLRFMGGKVLIHTTKIYTEAPPFSSGLELSYIKQTTGMKDWQQRYGFPEVGLNLFLSMNGSKQLGNAIGLYPSIQFRFLTFKQAYWYGKIGGGIGVISKRWSRLPFEDSMNNIIGSSLNNFTMFQTGFRFGIHPYWTAQAGAHFYHVSNAATRSPNFGINTFGLNVGINYHPQKSVWHFEKRKLRRYKNPLNISVSGSIAFAEDKTPDGPMYPIFTGSLSTYKMYRNKSRMITGADAIFNTKSRAIIRNATQMKDGKLISPWQYTAFLGHEFLFGQIGVPLLLGAYLNRPVGGEKMYQKLGMNYHFYTRKEGTFKDAYLALILKTHLVQAQYAELGFGFFL